MRTSKVVAPALPSFAATSETTTLHSNRRSCRWFLSPHPLPGFVSVGVVVVVDVELLVDVDVEVEVLVLVDVDVVVVVVIVVEYSYSDAAEALSRPVLKPASSPIERIAKRAMAENSATRPLRPPQFSFLAGTAHSP